MEQARIIKYKCDKCNVEKEFPIHYKGRVWGTRKFLCQKLIEREDFKTLTEVKYCDLKVIGERNV